MQSAFSRSSSQNRVSKIYLQLQQYLQWTIQVIAKFLQMNTQQLSTFLKSRTTRFECRSISKSLKTTSTSSSIQRSAEIGSISTKYLKNSKDSMEEMLMLMDILIPYFEFNYWKWVYMTIYLISTLMKWKNVYINTLYIDMIKIWSIVFISNKNDQMYKTEKI